MTTSKIAITIDQNLLHRIDFLVNSQRFKNLISYIQESLEEKLARIERIRL